jgi:hypothetical protein
MIQLYRLGGCGVGLEQCIDEGLESGREIPPESIGEGLAGQAFIADFAHLCPPDDLLSTIAKLMETTDRRQPFWSRGWALGLGGHGLGSGI